MDGWIGWKGGRQSGTDTRTDRRTDTRMDGWMDGGREEWLNGQMNGQMDRWMDGVKEGAGGWMRWREGGRDGRMDEMAGIEKQQRNASCGSLPRDRDGHYKQRRWMATWYVTVVSPLLIDGWQPGM